MTTAIRYANAFTGLAAGDAWGYQVEFKPYDALGPGFVAPPAGTWVISDDTQMTLALDLVLGDIDDFEDVSAVTNAITSRFLDWMIDPDNDRAPGRTCMGSLRNLSVGAQWHDADGAYTSAGCGAVMRLTPTAFAPDPYWLGLSALQAVITHKHPMAVAASLLLADATRHADQRGGRFIVHALAAADRIEDGTSTWLMDPYLLRVLAPVTDDLHTYLWDGFDGLLHAALRSAAAKHRELADVDPADYGDPCAGVGEGWEAASAVALALMVADAATGPDATMTGYQALGWAATSNGDSDSIACIAGSVIGAASTDANYWAEMGVKPRFEGRYAKEIAAAIDRFGAASAREGRGL